MPLRLTSLARVSIILFLFLLVLHFISSPRSSPESYAGYTDEDLEGGWTERLGLDHYADWEQGVTNRLGDGLDRVVGGLGAIKGGLGWGVKGTKLGSLYELVSTSNPSPHPGYFDERTSLDRIKLTSTRVLGHGDASSNSATADDDEDALAARPRRHILITGGFGSLGKYVVRDLLLGPSSGYGTSAAQDEWSDGGAESKEEDILVTILDVKDRTPELNFLLQSAPIDKGPKIKGTDPRTQAFTSSERSVDNFKRAGKLRTLVGDVRDPKLMATILAAGGTTITQTGTQQAAALLNAKLGRPNKNSPSGNHLTTTIVIPPVSGIIHLAAYDPKACRLNPVDCEDVETKGMSAILMSLKREGMDKAATLDGQQSVIAERPWIVVPRRSGAWEEVPNTFNANASRVSTPASEGALKAFSVHYPLHSLLLRLPTSDSILGDPYSPRFDPIPHIVQSALGHLPIQIYTSPSQTEPFLAIDDASRAVIQGARMLELASKKDYLRPLAFVGELTVVGPPNKGYGVSPILQVAQTAISLTQSQSAYAEIPLEGDQTSSSTPSPSPAEQSNHRKLTTKVLGFTPATSVRTSLKRYLTSLLKLQSTHLSSRINVACSSPPSTPVLEEGLLALSGCNSQLLTVIEGAYYTLGCSAGIETPHPEPLAIVPAVPFKEGVRGVEILAERGLEGKVDVQLRCPTVDKEGKLTGQSEVVIWADTERGGEFAEQSKEGAHPIAEWYSIDFIHRDSRSFTLTLPPTEGVPEGEEPKRRLTLKDPVSQKRDVLFQPVTEEARALLWRVNPICCSASDRRKDVWDYFKEDPILTSQVTYPSEDGRTTLSESTLSVKRCGDLRSEHDEIIKLQRFLASSRSDTICTPDRGTAHEWTPKDLPTCHIDCSAPLICMASETCKCTRDRCGDRLANGPFPSLQYSTRKSFNDTGSTSLSLTERVEAIPWESLILPGARRAFATPLDELPAAHVIDLPETIDNHLTSSACWNLDKSPLPFMGDHFLVEALRNRSVGIDDADFVVVPYYQGCYYNYLQENTFKKLADTVGYAETRVAAAKHISAGRIVIPFTHDFGSCTGWWPKLEDVLGRSPPSPMDQAIAWQVNGDYNTHCVKPDRDVVLPAVTKHTKALLATFGAFSSVTPSSKRKHLGFFAGGVRGFGAIVRTKIGCGRTTTDVGNGGEGASRILYQEYAPGQRYLGTLNSSKFCLLPRGIPAWTTRTFEAIYAGCIPAFVVDRNLFPFQDILDYSRFSITIPEAEAHRAEDILASYSDDRLAELQANLLRVREAFIFKEGEEWERKGPVFFSLVSMAMRLELEYPQVGSCVH
ncbi:Proteophosphoglycan ppg4 [Leucosporidium creatinivorum]|uniref:Proteophosphoglycan ppg4 n=1 Tax=Leucosporidium creatinivorum TaxID=106004 RepID=A0A1Y2EL46_9BASI|nr:Proteophosphoglycan ppg4 [Leucosporidium creatinivorum]